MPEERKLVTILFADVVGSTEIGESHDPEVVRATMSRMFEAQSEILRAHGGTVEKFIGDAVMAVFGVPSAHDDDAERAVRAAFALRDRVATLHSGGGPQLVVRVGINSGEAVTGSGEGAQFLVTGPVVNATARLQSAAAPGEILVGALTRRLTQGGVRYAAPRTVEAKGIGKLEAWAADDILTAVPEQHRGLSGLRAPLIGRDHEMRRLIDAHAAMAGTKAAHLVTIFGSAGSGKSRLSSEFLSSIGAERVRSGRCLPYGEGITYYAVQLILRADAGIELFDPHDVALAKLRAATLAVFADSPEDADAVARRLAVLGAFSRSEEALPDLAPEDLREELRWGLRRYLERRAAAEPLVLVFEDIHWAEPGLLDLIEYLAEWLQAPLFLICLARLEFRETRSSWGSGASNATAITLAPLTAEDTRQLIVALLAADDLPESLRGEIVSRAGGNPLYVEEFLRTLIETGDIEERESGWAATKELTALDVPPTLQGLITARLDRVAPDVKQLLQRASVAGGPFSTAALAALGDGAPPDPALLRETVRRDFLLEVDERALGSGRVFRFKHVLIRDVAYATVPKSERSRLHDRYGRWLEEGLGDRRSEIADIIAHHAEQAYALASELRAPQASELGRRALALLLEAARNARDRLDLHAAQNLYARAATVADATEATATERAESHGYVALFGRMFAPGARPVDELDAALTLARQAGPSRVLVDLLGSRALAARQSGANAEADRLLAEALEVAHATGDLELIAEAFWLQATAALSSGDLSAMHKLLIEALAYAKGSGMQGPRGRVLYWLGALARYRGDLSEERVYHDERLASVRYTKSGRVRTVWAASGFAQALGDLETAVAEGREALQLARNTGLPDWIALCCELLGDALLESGDAAGARELFLEGAAIVERRNDRASPPGLLAQAARACVRLGDLPAARDYAEAARASAVPADALARSVAAIALAEVREAEAEATEADELFREAIDIVLPTGFGTALAYARESYAKFLLRQGRYSDAREQLDLARAFHHDPLAERHRQRIDSLLARIAASA